MPDKVQIKRGLKAELPQEASEGELLLCTDTRELYAGINGKVQTIAFDSNSYLTSKIPVPETIGGIKKGTTFDNVHLLEVVKQLIYPYTPPLVSFTSNKPSLVEDGTEISGLKCLIKITKRMYDVVSLKLYKDNDLIRKWEDIYTDFETPSNYIYDEKTIILKDTTYKLTVTDEEASTNYYFKLDFISPVYTGVCQNKTPTTEEINQSNKMLMNKGNFTVSFTTNNQRMLLVYPQEWGDIKTIKDVNQFDITNSFSKQTIRYETQAGIKNYFALTSNLTTVKDFKVTFNF